MFPNCWEAETRQFRAGQEHTVGVATECAINSAERQRLRRRELKSGCDQESARALLEVVSAVEDLARTGWKLSTNPPIILNAARALVADDARTEIGARQLGFARSRAFDRLVNRIVDRLVGE